MTVSMVPGEEAYYGRCLGKIPPSLWCLELVRTLGFLFKEELIV